MHGRSCILLMTLFLLCDIKTECEKESLDCGNQQGGRETMKCSQPPPLLPFTEERRRSMIRRSVGNTRGEHGGNRRLPRLDYSPGSIMREENVHEKSMPRRSLSCLRHPQDIHKEVQKRTEKPVCT